MLGWPKRLLGTAKPRSPGAELPAGLAQLLAGSAISPEGQRARHVPETVEAHAQRPRVEAEATAVHRSSSGRRPVSQALRNLGLLWARVSQLFHPFVPSLRPLALPGSLWSGGCVCARGPEVPEGRQWPAP